MNGLDGYLPADNHLADNVDQNESNTYEHANFSIIQSRLIATNTQQYVSFLVLS